MTTLIAFIIILSILIFVHELGHFIVAKRSGIAVEEFAIGFPPRAIKLWQDEGSIILDGQEYVISRRTNVSRAVQSGAKVSAEIERDDQGRSVVTNLEVIEPADGDEKPAKDPAAGSEAKFFNLFSAKPKKSASSEPLPAKTVDTLIRPTEYSINWIPLGGYVRMVGEEDPTAPGSFASKSKRVRLAVLAAGSIMNLITAIFFFTMTSMAGVPEPVTGINTAGEEAPKAQTIITEVVPNTPADQAGLQAGDIILGADGIDFIYAGDLIHYVDQHKGTEITLQLKREEEIVTTSLEPRANPPENEGAMGIGITHEFESDITYYPLHTALMRGARQTAEYVGLVFYMPIAIIQDILPAEAARPTGPVGIYQQTDSAVNAALSLNWWFPILWLTAILSTALAVTNLLPLPALDGGRIMFVIIEALRGKRIAPEKEGAIHFIGLALLLTLMIVISYYDLSNPLPTIDWTNLF